MNCYMNHVSNSKEMLSEQKNLSIKKNLQYSSLSNYCFEMVIAMEKALKPTGADMEANRPDRSC